MTDRYVDAVGTGHPRAAGAVRIVSLVPSLTELVIDLGLADSLVGRTRFCIHPAEVVGSIARVGGTKDVRMDRLRALAPTHVIVNVDENTREAATEIATFVPHVIVTHPVAPYDNLTLYRLLGGIFGREREAQVLCEAYARAADALDEARERLPRQRVLYLIWREPWMTVAADTYIARMLGLVNWTAVAAESGARYPIVKPDAALMAGIDLVLFPSEPFPFSDAHLEAFRAEAGVTRQRLLRVDGEMLSWYGSRAVRGLDYLRALACAQLEQAA